MQTTVATTTGVKAHTKITLLIGMGATFFIGISLLASAAVASPVNTQSAPVFDTDPPLAEIITPFPSTVVSDTTTIAVYSEDENGVKKIELYLDGELKHTAHSPSADWDFPWDTSKVSNGDHAFLIKVHDTADNVTILDPLMVTVQN